MMTEMTVTLATRYEYDYHHEWARHCFWHKMTFVFVLVQSGTSTHARHCTCAEQ